MIDSLGRHGINMRAAIASITHHSGARHLEKDEAAPENVLQSGITPSVSIELM